MTQRQRPENEDLEDEVDTLDDDIELESFLDEMEDEDSKRNCEITARRKIEDLLEERRLRELIDDYPDDFDLDDD